MIFNETRIRNAFIIEIEKRADERGYFARAFCQKEMEAHGLNTVICQANIALSRQPGTLRGMHYQAAPYQEAKLVRCIAGAAFDAIIDLRPDSPSYKRWLGVELSSEKQNMIYVPEGCAHGYLTLAETRRSTTRYLNSMLRRLNGAFVGMIRLSPLNGQWALI
jgi:dTDP-4-dehydrorhamnose 3,5-epimerase